MKVAIPYLNGNINEHFGSSREFVVIEGENGLITGKKIIANDNKHGNLVSLLQSEGVDAVIACRISRPLMEMLFYNGIQVITRANGEAEKAASDFFNGKLATGPACRGGKGPVH